MTDFLHPLFHGRPSLGAVASQTCTAAQFTEDHYLRFARAIRQTPSYHRKQWEYIYILRVLEKLGLLDGGIHGLGFGCGKEPLAAVMVNRGAKVMVTDIPPFDNSDTHWGARSAMDLFYPGICSEDAYRENVTFRAVDMNHIPDDLGSFDFVWSCCALEHLGSLQAGKDFILNSMKCLKPGGIAVHTTELNVSSEDDTMESPGLSLYRRRDLLDLQQDLADASCSVMPMNFYAGDLPQDKYIDLPPYKQETHLKLQVESYVVTSFGLTVRRDT